jgi:hypothetical protein
MLHSDRKGRHDETFSRLRLQKSEAEKGKKESEKGENGKKKNSRAKLLYYFSNNLICLKSRNLE